MGDVFRSSDLASIKRRTSINYHTENRVFIAHKIKSKLEKDFKEIMKERDRVGYLSGDLSEKQYLLSKKLELELQKKYPNEAKAVISRL